MTIELFNGYTTTDPRLDRVPFLDPASRNYTIRERLAKRDTSTRRRKRPIVPGATLDQGETGGCTGFSISHGQESRPFKVTGLSDQTALNWYYANQKNDGDPGGEWPGAHPQRQGSTVLASMKTLQQLGLIAEYRWIGAGSGSPMDDLRDTLKYIGPVHLGTNWYDSMFTPEGNGLLTVDRSGAPAGGHAYCLHDWVSRKLPGTSGRRDYVVMQQSWGLEWGVKYRGQGGFAYIAVEDVEALLNEEGGEGAVPLKTS